VRRPLTTLPATLTYDIKLLDDDVTKLTTKADLEQLRILAHDRKTWFALTSKIRKTAEASRFEDIDNVRQWVSVGHTRSSYKTLFFKRENKAKML
jgi:antitoxin component of MazEF toxin-antitoxin module